MESLAGILTFPSLLYLPDSASVALYKQTFIKWGLQLQVQFRTLTGIPLHQGGIGHLIAFSGCKGTTFLLMCKRKGRKKMPPMLTHQRHSKNFVFFLIRRVLTN